MMYINQKKGSFAIAFKRQLQSLFENQTKYEVNNSKINDSNTVFFSFLLPNAARFPYTNYSFLYNELLEAFNSFYPSGINILSIKPNCNDDHYIEVTITLI